MLVWEYLPIANVIHVLSMYPYLITSISSYKRPAKTIGPKHVQNDIKN